MLPPKTASPGLAGAQTPLSAKMRIADHILIEGLQKGFVAQQDLADPRAEPPRSSGSAAFLSKFSARMKEDLADLALKGFSSDPGVLVDAACIIAVLSPREDELEILSAVFDARDRIEGRRTLQRLYEAGRISLSDMSLFISMENRMFPSLPGYDSFAAVSDEAPPTKRSVPPSQPARHQIEVSVTEGYTDRNGNSGYEIISKKT